MNEQKPPKAIEWTRVILPDGTRTRGYTHNPIKGCLHECRWTMPDGTIAVCYAEDVAEGVAQSAYPEGFAHHYWQPDVLKEPLKVKQPAGIFWGSMSDVFGAWVPKEQTQACLDVMREAHWHYHMTLTKNAPNLLNFEFADNVWVGASSPPDFMMGKPLSTTAKERMLARTLKVFKQLKDEKRAKVTWMSIEPLSWDISTILREHEGALDWAVIGAASSGSKKYAVDHNILMSVLAELDRQGVPVFFKGNLATDPYAAEHWREDFPTHRVPHDPLPPKGDDPEPIRPSRPESPRRADLHESLSVRVVNPERKPFNSVGVLEEIWELVTDPGHWVYNVRIEGLIYSYAAFDIEPDNPAPSGTPVPRIEVIDPEPPKPADPPDTFAPFIPALSIWQPWASLIALGLKHVETRESWKQPTLWRDDIVIHASKKWTQEERNAAILLAHRFPEIAAHASTLNNPPLGAALAVARVVDCVPLEKLRDTISPMERACGGYLSGGYGLILENVRVFPTPIPMIGQQSNNHLGWRIPHPLYHIEAPPIPAAPLTKFQLVRNLFDPETQAWRGDLVYIGRAMPSHRLPESVWANPFKIDKDTPEARRAAIAQYREYITARIAADPVRYDLNMLRGKTLVCWCTPDGSRGEHDERLCHGHVLLELLKEQEQPIPVKPLPPAPPPKDEIAALYQPFDPKDYQEHVTADMLAVGRVESQIAALYQRDDRNTPEWQTELERLRALRAAVLQWIRTKAAAPKPKQSEADKLREELEQVQHGIDILRPHAHPPAGSGLEVSKFARERMTAKEQRLDEIMALLVRIERGERVKA